jgi:hypothetical protein
MTSLIDFIAHRAKRDTKADTKGFVSSFSEDTRKSRFRKALIELIDTHADLGPQFLRGELEGAMLIVEVMPEQK